jgi:Carboxypeptidase regulatory-like domain
MPRVLAITYFAVFVFISCVGCGEAPSPTGPTSPAHPTPPAPAPPSCSYCIDSRTQSLLFGRVSDTAFRTLSDVRVEIVEGSQAGAFAITESNGGFTIPGPFSGAISVRASKEGYVTATQQIQILNHGVNFYLDTTSPSVDMTGQYSLTLVADSTCTAIPDVARKRTYQMAVAHHPRLWPSEYEGVLSGATFYRSDDFRVFIGVSGNIARLFIGEYGEGLVEELGSSTVEIWGVLDALMNSSGSSGSFSGAFTYCGGLPSGPRGTFDTCPARPAYCEALNHQFTLQR